MPTKHKDHDGLPSHLLHRCRQLADELYVEEIGRAGLTARQFAVLDAINRHTGPSQTTLVAATGIDRSTLAEMIGRLIERDLIVRKRTENDARANAVRLTPKGLRALKSVAGAALRAEARLIAPVPSAKRTEFLKNLAAIAALRP